MHALPLRGLSQPRARDGAARRGAEGAVEARGTGRARLGGHAILSLGLNWQECAKIDLDAAEDERCEVCPAQRYRKRS